MSILVYSRTKNLTLFLKTVCKFKLSMKNKGLFSKHLLLIAIKKYLRLTSKNDTFLEAFPPIPFEATQANSPESSAVAFKTVKRTTPVFSLGVKTLFTLLEAATGVNIDWNFGPLGSPEMEK